MKSTQTLEAAIDALAPEFTALSDAIWDLPQLRWGEHDAVERQLAVAKSHGLEVTEEVAGIPTAFCAEYANGGPVIAILGEYDALAGLSQKLDVAEPLPDPGNPSGNGHGCGHNLFGAGSLMAAVAVAEYLKEHNMAGTVRYYGCPAEEAAAGKTFMVKGGAFDGVDGAVAWHPGNALQTRQGKSLAYTQAYFTFTGTPSHAGAAPHLGRSALDAGELLNIGVNFLREHMEDQARVHYAFTDAGGASPNVVQASTTLYYVVRHLTVAQMRELYQRVVRIAEGAALMTDTELTIEFDGASSELLPNDTLEAALHRNVQKIGPVPFDETDQRTAQKFSAIYSHRQKQSTRDAVGFDSDKPLHDEVPVLDTATPNPQGTGSTDVGDVSWITPTVQIRGATCAIGTPPHSWQLVAQGKLPAAHKGMIHAAKAMAATAIDMLTDPELLDAATKEFEAVITETPYDHPIPDGVIAPPLRTA